MALPPLSICLIDIQQKTNLKTLTRSDKRTCLKDSDGEMTKEGAGQFHTSRNTEEKLVLFQLNQKIKPDVTIISTYLTIYINLHYNQFYIPLKFMPLLQLILFSFLTN
jgi:hypothetical protein